jgi:hypothetical protein
VKRHALVGPDIETPQRAVGRSMLHLRFPRVLYDNLNLYLKELSCLAPNWLFEKKTTWVFPPPPKVERGGKILKFLVETYLLSFTEKVGERT